LVDGEVEPGPQLLVRVTPGGSVVDPGADADANGCSCRISSSPSPPSGMLLLLCSLFLWRRRR
jgi:MYXO-CTERM domain-containing protein